MTETTTAENNALVSLNLNLPAPTVVAEQVNKAFHTIYGKIEEEIAAFVPDVTTEKGRQAIASLAYKIARTKTGLDEAAKNVTADQKQIIDAVNAERSKMREDLDRLKSTVRAPLDRWEAEQQEIKNRADYAINYLQKVGYGVETSADLQKILDEVQNIENTERAFGSHLEAVTAAHLSAVERIETMLADRKRYEAEQAELAQLRREKEEREAAEQKKKQERDYANSMIEHIRHAVAGLIGGEAYPYGILIHELESKIVPELPACGEHVQEVEAARVAGLKTLRDAMQADQEKQEAERQKAAAEKAEREAQEKIEAERRAKEQAERDRQEAEERHAKAIADAEAARIREAEEAKRREEEAAAKAEEDARRREEEAARKERERIQQEKAEEERQRLAQEKADQERAADLAHRKKVNSAATAAIMKAAGVSEADAQAIVVAIYKGQVPNVSISY